MRNVAKLPNDYEAPGRTSTTLSYILLEFLIFIVEHFTDADFDELEVEKDTVRNVLKGLVKRAIPEISLQARKKVDCQNWEPEDVRDYVSQIGEFCQELADALFESKIPGFALCYTHPETLLRDYADHFSESLQKTSHSFCFETRKAVVNECQLLA